jgi:hypothetical protein
MNARRLTSMALTSLCVLAGGSLLWSAPAFALDLHVFGGTFGEEGSENGKFEGPDGVAVNDTTHNVYVVDGGNNRVEEFASTGTYIGQFNGSAAPTGAFDEPTTIAVDNSGNPLDPSAGDVYVVDRGHNVVDKFSAGGVYEGQLTAGEGGSPLVDLEGVAVDPAGVVWVTQFAGGGGGGNNKVDSFSDALFNAFLSQNEKEAPPTVRQGLAADSEGRLYIAGNGGVVRYKGTEFEEELDGLEQVTGIAVDSSDNEVYLGVGEQVKAYTPHGALTEQFGSGDLTSSSGVAVDSSNDTVYVADAGADRVAIFDKIVLPDVNTSAELTNLEQEGSVMLNGTVDPDGEPVTSCEFEYGTETSYGSTAPCEPAPGSGSSPVAVHAKVSGLTPLTSYHYRLVAGDAHGSNPGLDHTFIAPERPQVEGESALRITSGSAELVAQVNPGATDTTYRIEYGPTTSYETRVSGDAGSGTSAATVRLLVQGLQPDSTYHFRVVAGNAVQREVTGPDQEFHTQFGGGEFALPDGRAWELVTPPDKHGSEVIALGNEQGDDIQAAQSGDGITYGATAPFVTNPAGSNSPEVTQVISLRSAPGVWNTQDIATPHNEGAQELAIGHAAEYKLFSSDLSLGLVEPNGHTPLPPLPPGSEKTVYLRQADGGYEALVTSANVPSGCKFGGDGEGAGGVQFVTGTPDMKHIILSTDENFGTVCLYPGVDGGTYEWSEGRILPIFVLPGGEIVAGRFEGVSNDGSRILWEYGGASYLRDMVRGETIKVIEGSGVLDAVGSRVFFGGSGGSFDTFEVTGGGSEPLAGASTKVTEDVGTVLGTSEDGSYVYFLSGSVLGDGAAHGAESGGDNVYVVRYDEATKAWESPVFITLLSSEDEPDWAGELRDRTSRVSPNGRFLAFMSDESLTGYDNSDADSGAHDEEVFLYDANTGHLVCASCDPTGARPVGILRGSGYNERLVSITRGLWEGRWLAANIPGWTTTTLSSALYQSRYLSNSGRLFFNSSDALVPADVNGKENVYEYEPAGVGSCQPPGYGRSASDVFVEGAGGCVGLISAGTSSEESAFLDASESGGDVFFLTLSKLSPQDYDTSLDIYDAHECTPSAPCAPPSAAVPPQCTTGDSCKPSPSPQPTIFGEAASETFSGAGNVVPSSMPTVTTRSLTRAQKLTKALTACTRRPKRKRAACERQARKRYGAKSARLERGFPVGTRRKQSGGER